MELYDSNEMRQYQAEDFYDDSILRELDESGFIDDLYEASDVGDIASVSSSLSGERIMITGGLRESAPLGVHQSSAG